MLACCVGPCVFVWMCVAARQCYTCRLVGGAYVTRRMEQREDARVIIQQLMVGAGFENWTHARVDC